MSVYMGCQKAVPQFLEQFRDMEGQKGGMRLSLGEVCFLWEKWTWRGGGRDELGI